MTTEEHGVEQSRLRKTGWKRWGPYLSERQWGTVREDYSPGGTAWEHFPHDHARSRAHRWREDGLAGISDDQQLLCLSLALWNRRDPIVKERLFGLTNREGNHGEDVKECYYYLDATPTHLYLKMLYKYPQRSFPYTSLLEGNQRRGRDVRDFGYDRFWNDSTDYCFDVIDGPQGNDPSLRPNQIFAVSLPESPLTPERQRAVLHACSRHLLTSHGWRSLARNHPSYIGHYGGSPRQRDSAYHQGTVWSWLLGPFVLAHLRVYGNTALAASLLEPMANHVRTHGLGTASEIFDGDPPFTPRGCIAQAWTVAELLRAWTITCGGGIPASVVRSAKTD